MLQNAFYTVQDTKSVSDYKGLDTPPFLLTTTLTAWSLKKKNKNKKLQGTVVTQ